MAGITLSTIVGGGGDSSPILLAPATITGRLMRGDFGTWDVEGLISHGLSKTGNTTSTSLTEVLNISGPGVIQFLGLSAVSSGIANPAKFRVVIDGVTVLDKTTGAVQDTECYMAVGGFLAGGGSGTDDQVIFFEAIPFYDSLVVSQAGDGSVPGVITLYSRLLM